MQYGIIDWDKSHPGSQDYHKALTNHEMEELRSTTQFYDNILETANGLRDSNSQFVFNLPFTAEQKPRDISILLHSSLAATHGPHNMEITPAAFLMEEMYNLIVRDREDIDDKSPDANPNLMRLLYSLGTFFGRLPKDIDAYLVFLWYYGLFTDDWKLDGPQYDYKLDDYEVLQEACIKPALASLSKSIIKTEYDRLIDVLWKYDYITKDPLRPDEYYRISPPLTYALRKIVYATEGPLTLPIYPLAIRLAAMDYHILRYWNLQYSEDFTPSSRMFLEKHTTFSLVITALNSEDNEYRRLQLLQKSPWKLFYVKDIQHMISDSDRRMMLNLSGAVVNTLKVWVEKGMAHEIDTITKYEDNWDQVLFLFWVQAYSCAEIVTLYHNETSLLAEPFDVGLQLMRWCKNFGERFDDERKAAYNMKDFDESVLQAEEIRRALVERGILKSEEDTQEEPPPPYNPDA